MFLFIRKKKSDYETKVDPVTIANKVASNKADQQSDHSGKQGAEQNIYEKPTIKESLTIKNEHFEMQKM